MVFGRTKDILSSWGSSRPVDSNLDLEVKARAKALEAMHKTVSEIQLSMQVYLASWHAMCQASRAIAEGLDELAQGASAREGLGERSGVSTDREQRKRLSSLMDTARAYSSAHQTIDKLIREPTKRVVEDVSLKETGTLLSRFPPIFRKMARRRQLLANVEAAKSKVRTAEAAKDRERDSFSVVVGNENRRRTTAALMTAISAADGMTAEVFADSDRLERERGSMLVPQISALVGCQAFFMRRSAAVLERLAEQLPYSALSLCRLVRPHALKALPPRGPLPPPTPSSTAAAKAMDFASPTSTVRVDFSAHSIDSFCTVADVDDVDGDGDDGSSSSMTGTCSPRPQQQQHPQQQPQPQPQPQQQQQQQQQTPTRLVPALHPLDRAGDVEPHQPVRSLSAGPRMSCPPPLPPRPVAMVGARRNSEPVASTSESPPAGPRATSSADGAGLARPNPDAGSVKVGPAPLVEQRPKLELVADEQMLLDER